MSKMRKPVRKPGFTRGELRLACFLWFIPGGRLLACELTEGSKNVLAHVNMQSLRDKGLAK